MYEAKQQQASNTLSKEWGEFYQALGMLNTNLAARAIEDPSQLKEIIGNLVKWCTTHADQCGPGEIYDRPSDRCVRFPPVSGVDDGGGVG